MKYYRFIGIVLLATVVLFGCTPVQQTTHDVENEPRMTCTLTSQDIPELKHLELHYFGSDDRTVRLIQNVTYEFENDDKIKIYEDTAKVFTDTYKDNPAIKHSYEVEGQIMSETLDIDMINAEIDDLVKIGVIPDASSKDISMGLVKEQYKDTPMVCKIIGEE